MIDAEIAQFEVDGVQVYDFVFGGTYSFDRGESNETRQAIIESRSEG